MNCFYKESKSIKKFFFFLRGGGGGGGLGGWRRGLEYVIFFTKNLILGTV